MSDGVLLGVDTFTDIFVHDEASGRSSVAKVPSTRGDQAEGLIEGIEQVAEIGRVRAIVHRTTVATNALLERTGARCGVITTAGSRDILEMRRRDRPRTWGLWGQFQPIVPRDLRLEVDERTLADGTVELLVDLLIEKVAYSAFYMTRLEWLLRKCAIEHLHVAGIVTNGGVASTVRDAHVRDFRVTVIEDACAAFDQATHEAAIAGLRPVAEITTIEATMLGLASGTSAE